MSYENAVDELYQSPHDAFVAERRRLAAELKAAGDADGAARLAKLARPTASAWAVDQLWWHARDAFEQMFATASRLRAGEFRAMPAHREAIAQLRARATRILEDAGHNASEIVMRRVTTTLAALAAEGSFGTDRPGTLAVDREAPGFGPGGGAPGTSPPPLPMVSQQPQRPDPRDREREEAMRRRAEVEAAQAAVAAAAAAAAAEAERRVQEAARRAAERARVEDELRDAKGELTIAERDVAHFEAELADARIVADRARSRVSALTVRLAADWEGT